MSEENVGIARKAFAAVHSDDPDAFRKYFPDDCIWYPLREWPDAPEFLTGHQGILDAIATWRGNFDDYTAVLHEVDDGLDHRRRLAGAGAGEHQQRAALVGDDRLLGGVEQRGGGPPASGVAERVGRHRHPYQHGAATVSGTTGTVCRWQHVPSRTGRVPNYGGGS